MMTTTTMATIIRSKEETSSTKGSECCMCGDYGLSDELFQCDVCGFRSQHRYCSNLYPKAESYRACNWCLTLTDHQITDSTDPMSTQNSSTSSPASQRTDAEEEEDPKSTSKKSRTKRLGDQGLVVQINIPDRIKKQSKTPSPPSAIRKRIITRGALEERLPRTKSEEFKTNIDNKNNNNNNNNDNQNKGIITKQVFRNKVRRYKLLDEVSC